MKYEASKLAARRSPLGEAECNLAASALRSAPSDSVDLHPAIEDRGMMGSRDIARLLHALGFALLPSARRRAYRTSTAYVV